MLARGGWQEWWGRSRTSVFVERNQSHIGRYRIVAEHGHGGMGVIYRGQDDSLGRTAAIKLLSPDRVSNPTAQAAFQKEAKAISKLKHAHIASLYEYNDSPQEPYLAMEWVDGQSLKQLLESGPISLERAMLLLSQMLSALDYAHSLGIIHRDIKPANLMVREGAGEPQLVLVDFGLATIFSESGGTTSITGPLFGTPLYLPPEIAAGEKVDGRADLYGAALVFYEMLTAKSVFGPGTVTEIISQHLHAQRPVLSEQAPHLPVALDEVVKKALDRFPDQRYQTGKEFSEAVFQAASAGPTSVKKSSDSKMSTTTKVAIGMAIFALLAGLALALFLLFLLLVPDIGPSESPSPTPSVSRSVAPSISPSAGISKPTLVWQKQVADARYLAHGRTYLVASGDGWCQVHNGLDGEIVWRTQMGGQPTLHPLSEPTQLLLKQKTSWVSFDLASGKKLWRLDLKAPVLAGVESDDEMLYVTTPSEMIAIDPADGTVSWRAASSSPILSVPPAVGPSEVIVATADNKLRAFDLRTHKEVWNVAAVDKPTCLALAPKGILMVGCEDGQAICLSQRTGKPFWGPVSQSSPVLNILPWTDQTIVAGKGGEIGSYDEEGTVMWMFQAGEELAGPVEYDGELINLVTKSGQLAAISITTGRELWSPVDLLVGDQSKPLNSGPISAEEWLFQILPGQIVALKSHLPSSP